MTENASENCDAAELATRLCGIFASFESVAVAYSGGVDSAVVAKAATLVLGERAVAVTAVSPSLAQAELSGARAEAEHIGIRHVELTTDEFERSEYVANAGDRCFYCKETLYRLTASQLNDFGAECIVNGANLDDTGDHRPGMHAAQNYGVRSPLIEAGFRKSDVRELARYWKLSVADKPASPCLSSRIAYGVEVTPERVHRVEAAEEFLRTQVGSAELRVRVEANDLARIEVPLDTIPLLAADDIRSAITAEFRRLGFRYVTLDLEGFRSGSLNEVLPVVPLQINSEPATTDSGSL